MSEISCDVSVLSQPSVKVKTVLKMELNLEFGKEQEEHCWGM
uniref:Uncharacterized protein n=1 Tax=Anguilla anguilla TaxID=7936 RepID=A0A0E9VAK9_ANGAN